MMTGPTVLVLRALGLGDLCAGVPALRALRRAFPDHRLVLAAPAWQEPLARLAGVDDVVDTAGLAPIPAAARRAEVAVNLHGRGPQSTALLAATDPGRLIAFGRGVEWRAGEHEVHRWCRLLTESGIPADPADSGLPRPALHHVPPALSRFGGTGTNRYRIDPVSLAVVHPGAASAARRWPAERFGAVVAHLVDHGHHVALTGTAGERARCEAVAAAAGAPPAVTVLAGETDLLPLAATVAAAGLVVSNDTGVAHLATAFRTPSVVLFGPTPPEEWGPPPDGPHRALWAGRRGDPHGTELDPGLAAITVDQVLHAIGEVHPARVPV